MATQSSLEDQHPPGNLALRNPCDVSLKERHRKPADRPPGSAVRCSVHGEKLKSFCLTDQQPICRMCCDSKKHAGHRFKPIEEVALSYKGGIQKSLASLKKRVGEMNEIKQRFNKTAEHIKFQTLHVEKLVAEEFKKLHEFLHREEQGRMAELREEEERKSKNVKGKIDGLSREISALKDTIRDVEAELKADDVVFLQNHRETVRRTQYNPDPYPEPYLGALINVAYHLGDLPFRVLQNMQNRVSHNPVTLNPNTANPHLVLCNDLTSVTYGGLQPLPDNPERFDYWYSVLGYWGFDSGVQHWDVEVGDNASWQLGVARALVQTRGNGMGEIWRIGFNKGLYTATPPFRPGRLLSVGHNPKKIRVRLDFDGGLLTFSDPDRRTHLYTFKRAFRGVLLPWFFCGRSSSSRLRLLPQNISVEVEKERDADNYKDWADDEYLCYDSDCPSDNSSYDDDSYYTIDGQTLLFGEEVDGF